MNLFLSLTVWLLVLRSIHFFRWKEKNEVKDCRRRGWKGISAARAANQERHKHVASLGKSASSVLFRFCAKASRCPGARALPPLHARFGKTRWSEETVNNKMSFVFEEVDEAELIHVALVRSGASACLRGYLKKSSRAVVLKPLHNNRWVRKTGECRWRVLK